MTKQRNNYLYELVGVINKKHKRFPGKGKYLVSYYWTLEVEIESKPEIKSIKTFPDRLENKTIWKVVESNQYLGKRYVLLCKNWRGIYYLINWKELGPSCSASEDHA